MNVDEAMELFGTGNKKFWTLQSGDHFNAGETLACEVERLRAEVQRLDIAGTHTCHDDCPKLPCVQRREIERLRAEVESVIRLGPHPVEQVEMPLDVFVKTRFVQVWEYNELADKVHRLEAELAEAKAASVCPVKIHGCFYSVAFDHFGLSSEAARRFDDWLRDRVKERNEG